ncbi:hypothetical protein Tmar_2168 [Thermaerobacter marianensis DSM 12885]|uniref:DUF3048 domain-containing protein n=1 Tax=Thermaerobacter marianensis (strain ATCC 700841 / DSM 12885 / JCM 10246 / 7p75a) TaxID=644966 RepID=E6SK90_THEM7|nr:DUF3048 domain-containing protein [Thermaerobacter marianensis]ADU52248.1 hypothetical protein Tmar_2168 [Thermaerobacter marianensis DSM 12885]
MPNPSPRNPAVPGSRPPRHGPGGRAVAGSRRLNDRGPDFGTSRLLPGTAPPATPARPVALRIRRALAVVMMLASAFLAACSRWAPATAPTAPSPPSPAQPGPSAPPPVINPLTGLPAPGQESLHQRPVLVSIDNHPDARPQAGLTAADLVYEIPAEGGITRLLALFVTQRPERVGPVRSSRHYFLDLALEWDALYVHAGGSPQHYERIGRTGLDDLDGVRSDPKGGGRRVFTRDGRRAMPHNLYASLPVALAAARERGWAVTAAPPPAPFRFLAEGDEPAGDPVQELVIHWPGWRQGWVRYRWTGAGFLRETAFGPHTAEETGQPLAPANLLIQFVPARRIPGDAAGRLDVDVVGQGRLLIASGGRLREGRWEKTAPDAPTRWLEAGGGPVQLVPGSTWIHLVPASTRIDVTGPAAGGDGGEGRAPAGDRDGK